MSKLDRNPVCLICVRKIPTSSKKSSFGGVGGGDWKLFRRLLIFAERRLKLGGSITSVFLSSADYQRHHLEPPPIVMKNDNYFNSINENQTKAEIFCAACSGMVKNLCQLYDNICTIERLMLRKLEEFGEKLQENEQQQAQSLSSKLKLKSKSNDGDLKLNQLKRQKLAQQIEELRLDKGQDQHQQDPDTDGPRRSRRSGAEITRLRDLLVRQVREHLQEMNDPVPVPETVTLSPVSDSVNCRCDPDLDHDPKSQVTPPQPQPSTVNNENQNQPRLQNPSPVTMTTTTLDMDHDEDDVYDGHDHDDHDDTNLDADDDVEDDEDERPSTPPPPRKRRSNAPRGSSEDEDWEPEPSTISQKPTRDPLSERGSPSSSAAAPPPPKKRRRRRRRTRGGKDSEEEESNNSGNDDESSSTDSSSRQPLTEEQRKWKARPCGICGIAFRNGCDLMTHMKRVHENKMRAHLETSGSLETFSKFQCIFCPESYFLEESLQVHKELMEKNHDNRFGTEFRFRCDGPCGEGCPIAGGISYVTLGDLSDHLERDHAGETIFKCSKCQWSFLNKNSRDFHETLHAVGKRGSGSGSGRIVQCPAAEGCPLTFPKLSLLQKHFSQSHADGLKPFECSKCPISKTKKFSSMLELQKHQQIVHERAALIASIEGDGDFVCELCSKRFKLRQKLIAHQVKCRRKNQCDVCEEKFENIQELIDHLTLKHFPEGRYICPHKDCGKAYQILTTFKVHVKRHEDEASKTFLCPHCPKTYHHQSSFKNHLEVEHSLETTGEERKRTKVCPECGAAYFTSCDLRDHRAAKHVTEETEVHQCPLCEKNFTVKGWLKTHIRRMHKKDWREILGGVRSGHIHVN